MKTAVKCTTFVLKRQAFPLKSILSSVAAMALLATTSLALAAPPERQCFAAVVSAPPYNKITGKKFDAVRFIASHEAPDLRFFLGGIKQGKTAYNSYRATFNFTLYGEKTTVKARVEDWDIPPKSPDSLGESQCEVTSKSPCNLKIGSVTMSTVEFQKISCGQQLR